MTRASSKELNQSEKAQLCHEIHYLPHHCVVREDKLTTKLRIVYNASARENGPALNDCLHTGPPLTPDILDILIRFRIQPIALVADIEKAFLMIAVKKEDRDVLRFLWVDDVNSAEPKIVGIQICSSCVWSYVESLPLECNSLQAHHQLRERRS